jgi:hypothetical protein
MEHLALVFVSSSSSSREELDDVRGGSGGGGGGGGGGVGSSTPEGGGGPPSGCSLLAHILHEGLRTIQVEGLSPVVVVGKMHGTTGTGTAATGARSPQPATATTATTPAQHVDALEEKYRYVHVLLEMCTDPVMMKQRVTDWLMHEMETLASSVRSIT